MSALSLQSIASKDLKMGKLLGEGAYGEVYLGTWNGKEVAIKKLILKKLPAALAQDFEKETKIMAECGKCQQVVKLYGICSEIGQYSMIMEYMPKGSLSEVLSEQEIDLPWPLRLQMAVDVGQGLSYLHENEILHRDLKSHNVLLDTNFHAKITDFGLSKLKLESSSKSKQDPAAKKSVGTLRWQAPELFKLNPQYTRASDIYAYAMVLWEIASRKIPYGDADDSVIINCVKEGERETVPEDCPPKYGELIQRSWTKEPEKRPGSHYIVTELAKLLPPPSAHSTTTPAPSIVPVAASTIPKAPPHAPTSPQIAPSSQPTTETLRARIVQLLDHPEMKNYPSLSPLLDAYLDALLELADNLPLADNNLKNYKLIQMIITPENKISPSTAARLEKALVPQGNPPAPSSPAPAAQPVPAPAPVLAPVAIKVPLVPDIPAMAFGKAQWERFFGDVGVEPALPANIEEILNSPCPFWSGKKVRETHLLTLVPKTVGGQLMTLRSLGELVKTPKQGHSSQYRYFWDTALTELGDKPVAASHWVLMTKDVLPGTRRKPYAEQQKSLNGHYEVPALLDAAIAIFMQHAETGTHIYNDNPYTYTRCQEVCQNYRMVVGGFASAGLRVSFPRVDVHGNVGLAACWKFF